MKSLYIEYRGKTLGKEVIGIAPARPQMEFPKAQQMKKIFVMFIGSQIYHSLDYKLVLY